MSVVAMASTLLCVQLAIVVAIHSPMKAEVPAPVRIIRMFGVLKRLDKNGVSSLSFSMIFIV